LIEAGVMHAHDIGVIEPGGGPRFPEKSLHNALAWIGLLEDLECHVAIQPGIEREIDLPESTIS
jgi:hypothetical protein